MTSWWLLRNRREFLRRNGRQGYFPMENPKYYLNNSQLLFFACEMTRGPGIKRSSQITLKLHGYSQAQELQNPLARLSNLWRISAKSHELWGCFSPICCQRCAMSSLIGPAQKNDDSPAEAARAPGRLTVLQPAALYAVKPACCPKGEEKEAWGICDTNIWSE